ncbi:TonB-dependent receptor [Marinicauda sp. Alg238-R41]|uniref:TonB-dependent receptor n=1 Tax=Marinicauda sp. Alg238-R41 TaxID=2993447 RepID=UPI0022E1C505|nr:TonB-dependent receptor [Marinicauda sp. Alg238-R41]
MKSFKQGSALALVLGLAGITGASAQTDTQTSDGPTLDVIQVTAQRREASVQDSAIAISAITGENLEKDRILSFEDLASSVTSLSFTALSPLDQEFNIRGITNTRLDSPSADQSVGIFLDEVYVGRSGLFNADLYDIERVEVVRGPQGVLLGRNVVGGAISIITAAPEFEEGGAVSVSIGNYDEVLVRGHVTGPLTDTIAGRISFQSRNRGGYNHDILHDRELDNLESFQARGQLLFQSDETDLNARLILDYMNDESNGFHSVAINGPDPATQGPWSAAREAVGAARGRPLDLRESLPEHPRYAGDANESPQALRREAWGVALDIDKGIGDIATLTSITGYRQGHAFNLYDQTGMGPDNGYGVLTPTLFSFPVNEREEISQFTQEVRLVSNLENSRFDWIVGAYYQKDDVEKFDRFWAEVPLPVLVTLSGESHWDNYAETTSMAVFGQLGYQFTDWLRVVAGVRYTEDEKTGTVFARAVEGGDQFNPTDQVALTPLAATFQEGDSFSTDYGQEWEEITPQITAEFSPMENAFFYATWSRGYKGGGFEDDPANPAAAQAGYDPETVENIEIGAKLDFLDRRARLNVAAFMMDYQDLQVTQTDDGCLCNITDNAADAEISGIEAEFTFAASERLLVWAGGTVLETEYIDFIDGNGLDNSGNQLQRTPETQFNVGAELTLDFMDWQDALSLRANYTHSGEMYWAPDNAQTEDAYGLLDGRISLAPADRNWSVSVWGKNLTDETYRTNIIAFFGDEVSRLGAPRTYGIELSTTF